MQIEGVQKLTLLDFPGHVACTVFTPGCNFRCPFCHNASLVVNAPAKGAQDPEELFRFLSKRRGILDGVALTGGEPLLQQGVEEFLRRVKELGFKTKLDTNGSFPDRLRAILDAGLADYVAVDIKNSPAKYPLTTGCTVDFTAQLSQTIKLLAQSGADYEFRTTIVAEYHTDADILAMGEWINGAPRWFLQKFEDSGELICGGLHAADEETMNRFLQLAKPFVGHAALRGM
ncbi:MAG: anaerobic ribonucleoside-triphosphate reductase activating protein [Oscillospiraceae bacterium]|nr:anaerobic ribonucleoside-triphosphate reductase activating protein [Oscillospiraceae bacterium]